ncbi:MAG: hypothetical protein H6Q15_414 [Bacteroidetes bacterium]|nr:hypothetical protein [Bacteroidota bacterium]
MKNLEDNKFSEELNQIFENAAVVLILVNIEGTIIHINKTGIQMLNKNKNDVLGHLAGEALNCINACHEGQIVCGKGKDCCNCPLRNTFSDTFNSGKSHYQNQGDLEVNVNGEIVRLNLLVSTSIIIANNEKYVLITIDDITREKQYQNEIIDTLNKYQAQSEQLSKALYELNVTNTKLIESESYLKTILDTEPDCVKLLDPQGKLVYMNPAGLKMIDADNLEQVKGKSMSNLIIDKYKRSFKELIEETLKGGRGILEFEAIGFKGRRIWLETNCVPLYNNEKISAALGITRDITEYKKAEKALKDSEKQFRELNATKNIFFSIIAHDLRNPFNAINGFAEILLENHNSYSNQEKEQYFKIIAESSQSAQELLENLLEWSKIQIGIISFNPKSQDIDNIINTVINQTKLFAIKKNIKVDNLLHDTIIASVDNMIIITILRNLLINAIKFTPQFGNVSINAKIEKSELIISVQDTGVGISKKNLHKLFKISEKCSSLGTEQEKGSGLGLIICKEFITIHGGKIWVESEEGKGSCFSFSIPIQDY